MRWVRGVAIARVRVGSGTQRQDVPLPAFVQGASVDEERAELRCKQVAELAARMRKARIEPVKMREHLLNAGAAPTDRELRAVVRFVDGLIGGKRELAGMTSAPTVREIGQLWTDGTLAAQHPDHIPVKRSVRQDAGRLRLYVYDVVGDIPVDRFALDDAERVMRALPPTLGRKTRRDTGKLLARILNLAVFPLRLIPHSPLPRGWLPKPGKQKALGYLTPPDDAALLACKRVPLALRMLYGFIAREGMRPGEAFRLAPSDISFDLGMIRLDKNKTDDPRMWALSPGVADALRIYCEHHRPKHLDADAPLFVNEFGLPFSSARQHKAAAMFRRHLRMAGVDKLRPELFERSDARMMIRLHDLRATFVTLSLARGKSPDWVADRTGHRDWKIMKRYRRAARQFAELNLGELTRFELAVPELAAVASDQASTTAAANQAEPFKSADIRRTAAGRSNPAASLKNPRKPAQPTVRTLTPSAGAGQSLVTDQAVGRLAHQDAVSGALADALTRAAAAGQWDTVTALTAELAKRRALIEDADRAAE